MPNTDAKLVPGSRFPDCELTDHAGNRRTLSELVAGDPAVLQFYRGWWCPKEQAFFRRLAAFQGEVEVAYSRVISVSVDPPEVSAAFRAGIGARWTFLSDADRAAQAQLGLRETTDTVHDPYVPAVFTLFPDLTIHSAYNGYWFWGRPTLEELRGDLRAIQRSIRRRLGGADAMSWCWFDLLDAPSATATAQAATVGADGHAAGWLAAWRTRARPTRGALRIDDRVVDPDGAAAWVSLVRPPQGVRLPFDDLAVQQARRNALSEPWADAVSTLLSDASHFEGAITIARDAGIPRLRDDPFARVFGARVLRVDAGLFGRVPPPCGPTIERYGSANPWPWDRFQ